MVVTAQPAGCSPAHEERTNNAKCSAWNDGNGSGGVLANRIRDGDQTTMSRPAPARKTRRLKVLSNDRRHEFPIIEAHSDEQLDVFEENRIEFHENVGGGKLYAEYRRLAAEQAALRRLAELVSRGVEPRDVFAAVADEMRQCLTADTVELWRFETDCEITMLADSADPDAL